MDRAIERDGDRYGRDLDNEIYVNVTLHRYSFTDLEKYIDRDRDRWI